MVEAVISARNVNHYYGSGQLKKQILFDVSVDLLPGEIVILTGPSGSGKTTLLMLSGALRSLEDGSLKIFDQELNGAGSETLERIRRSIGFIFQGHNLIESLTACQNVQLALELDRHLSPELARNECIEMLAAVGLRKVVDSYPNQLSGGQKQRVAIARALVRKPTIILADEPTAALDKASGREVVEILRKLAKQNGCAILMVTHDNRILDTADRILTLEDGRIISFTAALAATTGHLLNTFAQLHRRGDLLRHIGNLSNAQFIEMIGHLTAEFEQLLSILDLGNAEMIQALLDELLGSIALKIQTLLQADRVTVFLVDFEHGMLHSKIAQQGKGEPLEINIPISSGIAGHVALSGETLNVAEAYEHPAFNRDVDLESGYRTHSVLCMPIKDSHGRVFAVAQLLNKKDGGPFTTEDEHRFNEFSGALGAIVESWARLRKR